MQQSRPHLLARRLAVARWRVARLPGTVRGLMWSAASGLVFVTLNTLLRDLTQHLSPYQVQFLRYLMAVVVLLPLALRAGLGALRPQSIGSQFVRGGVHTLGLCLWFMALGHITLADTTAIGFTGPIFIMLGAALFLGEPMRKARWVAAFAGMGGVLIVVGPQLTGQGGIHLLLMLGSAPVFAASFLMTKAMTRYESASIIVLWQAITVSILSLPLALPGWQAPSLLQWGLFLVAGVLGNAGHYCLARSYAVAEISATQSVKFLELVWAAALGWLVFGDISSHWTLVGGVVICTSTVWIARREARGGRSP